jgi:hypothetical protein
VNRELAVCFAARASDCRSEGDWLCGRDVLHGIKVDREPARGMVLLELSAQLAVLAAAPVIAAELRGFPVFSLLARDAKADTRDRLAPRFWDLRATFSTVSETRSLR